MSTVPPNQNPQVQVVPVPVQPAMVAPEPPKEIRIVGHCTLFYWWPVWAVGFVMALITWLYQERMVLVTRGSELKTNADVVLVNETLKDRSVWVLPPGKTIVHDEQIRISHIKRLGVMYSIILLLVIAITNIPLRGLWSVIVLVLIVSLSIILSLIDGAWERILSTLQILDVRINLEGYLLISSVLLLLWLVVFLFFDNQIYMVFTPGQLRVHTAIGDAETAYDTTGMTIQKQRSDLFRHWILGLGSGDLIVNTSGAQSHHFEMPNVLFIGRKVNQIEMMLSSRQVVSTKEMA
jgi:hypothetical protein